MKKIKYTKIAILVVAGWSIIDLMTGYGKPGRFQFHEFITPALFRTSADIILLVSLMIIGTKQWTQQKYGMVYWGASILYSTVIVPDINSWLFNVSLDSLVSLYLLIIIVHTLPILIIIDDLELKTSKKIKMVFMVGFAVILIATALRIVVSYWTDQTPTDDIFNNGCCGSSPASK